MVEGSWISISQSNGLNISNSGSSHRKDVTGRRCVPGDSFVNSEIVLYVHYSFASGKYHDTAINRISTLGEILYEVNDPLG